MVSMSLQCVGFNTQFNYHRYETAKLLYQGSLSFWRDIQRVENGMGIIRGLVGLAEIAAIQGETEHSGWLFGALDHLTPSSGFYRDNLNERLAQTREQLDGATVAIFEAGRAEGQKATLEQAIQKALHETYLPTHCHLVTSDDTSFGKIARGAEINAFGKIA
jgi:hypothetical protein